MQLVNIVKALKPLNMDIDSYNCYKNNGLKKDEKYILKLKALADEPDYKLFGDVIDAIAAEKVTVEQESFLERIL